MTSRTPPRSTSSPVQPPTPDTPYHSVKESGTDISGSSDEGDYYSDATEGRESEDGNIEGAVTPSVEKAAQDFTTTMSDSIPILVVDKTVDDHPVHGSAEGNPEAYAKRAADAEPDVLRQHQDETTTRGAPNPLSASSIPTLIVDKTEDDHTMYGTVEGTIAYEKRTADAEPDITLEHRDSHTTKGVPTLDTDVPMVVLERTPDDHRPYGSIPGTPAYHKRAADSIPDEIYVRDADLPASSHARSRSASTIGRPRADSIVPKLVLETVETEPTRSQSPITLAQERRMSGAKSPDGINRPPFGTPSHSRSNSRTSPLGTPSHSRSNSRSESPLLEAPTDDIESAFTQLPPPSPTSAKGTGEGFDDFDDFGEAQEGGDDDFGDFGEFDEAATPAPTPVVDNVKKPFVPDFSNMTGDEIYAQASEIISALYPSDVPSSNEPLPPIGHSMFLSDRSLSLWNQLSAPPPLQPPNWKLSRIRRLFLVSLGVPVDLDEILPAETKQKKLVLPSASHGRKSTDGSGRSSSATPLGRSSSKRNKKDKEVKLVDVQAARIMCSTSDVRLQTMTGDELEAHVERLEEVTKEASETLTYWLGKRETAMGDKETFESVIENLVVFARKGRKP